MKVSRREKEREYQLTLLLRSVYIRGTADAHKKSCNMDWESSIIKQINELYEEVEDA